jgi:hypothetical protein
MNPTIDLPPLAYKGHEKEKMTLHLFLQVIGKIRMGLTPRKNHWWYVTEYVDSQGFTTGPIPYDSGMSVFSITLNVHQHQLQALTSKDEEESFALSEGMSVAEFYEKLFDILKKLKIEVSIIGKPYDLPIDKPFGEITEYHHYKKSYVKALWQILIWVNGVFEEYSGGFYGKTSPVHLYWHSMDLAVGRFSGEKAPPMGDDARISDKDAYTHECLNCGFWAGDENVPEPAFYSYTYPSPKGIDKQPLPFKAEWIDSNGSPMALLRYGDLLKTENPRKTLLDFMNAAYRAGASLAGWDMEKFRVPALKEL